MSIAIDFIVLAMTLFHFTFAKKYILYHIHITINYMHNKYYTTYEQLSNTLSKNLVKMVVPVFKNVTFVHYIIFG